MCMVTHFKQLFLFLENWLPESPRGDFITNWNERVITKLHGISILRLYHCKIPKRRTSSFWHPFYFVMKSQNISFLLEINSEYLKKILCLLVSNQECAKIFIPFASCSMLKKMQFWLQFQLLQSMEPRYKLNKMAAKGIILFHSILFMKIILNRFFSKIFSSFFCTNRNWWFATVGHKGDTR